MIILRTLKAAVFAESAIFRATGFLLPNDLNGVFNNAIIIHNAPIYDY